MDAGGQIANDVAQVGVAAEASGEYEIGLPGCRNQRRARPEAEACDAHARTTSDERGEPRVDVIDLGAGESEGRQAVELRHEDERAMPGENPSEPDQLGMASPEAGQAVDEK